MTPSQMDDAHSALMDLWEALLATKYVYRVDSEDSVERKIAIALRKLEELTP